MRTPHVAAAQKISELEVQLLRVNEGLRSRAKGIAEPMATET